MKRLFKMAFVFIIKSKMLSISVFISIFVACFLSVSMFQLSSNMERSIEKVIEEEIDTNNYIESLLNLSIKYKYITNEQRDNIIYKFLMIISKTI